MKEVHNLLFSSEKLDLNSEVLIMRSVCSNGVAESLRLRQSDVTRSTTVQIQSVHFDTVWIMTLKMVFPHNI